MFGAAGHDTLLGNVGDDVLWGGAGTETLRGGGWSDKIFGDEGADRIFGEVGHDLQSGDGSADTLSGGDWSDRLFRSTGDDTLHGGVGEDSFVFFADSGHDRIADFNAAEDRLWLSSTLWGGTPHDAQSLFDQIARVEADKTVLDFGNGNAIELAGSHDSAALVDSMVF